MRTILILVSLLIIGNTVIAQNSNEKFTLGQCLDFAINNSYATHRANLDVIEAGYQINEARSNIAWFYPQRCCPANLLVRAEHKSQFRWVQRMNWILVFPLNK